MSATFGPAGITMGLESGSWIALAPDIFSGLTETIGGPASMLIATVLPTGPAVSEAIPAGTPGLDPDYTSVLFGYTLSWDDSWTVTDESANASGESTRSGKRREHPVCRIVLKLWRGR